MSTQGIEAAVVILGLKKHFGVESDEALAIKLNVAKSTIATWRRRSAIPTKTIKELEAQHGLTFSNLTNQNSDLLRDYVLRQAYYLVILDLHKILIETGITTAEQANFADDLALIEPYLRRAIIRAASEGIYQGVAGAASFLLDLRAGKLKSEVWVAEAKEQRRRDMPR